MWLLLLARDAAACAASAARGCLRVRSPVACEAVACAASVARGCRLRTSDPTSAWAVSSIADAIDLYAHLVYSRSCLFIGESRGSRVSY
ncbi:hypothetical protein GW17_00033134 [Ensete ventricosum]|nr:hypothetical protein GW17_00033134 [Ensete ventricosum]